MNAQQLVRLSQRDQKIGYLKAINDVMDLFLIDQATVKNIVKLADKTVEEFENETL